MDGWMDGWTDLNLALQIAYSNKNLTIDCFFRAIFLMMS
jgi:hypothetical protein